MSLPRWVPDSFSLHLPRTSAPRWIADSSLLLLSRLRKYARTLLAITIIIVATAALHRHARTSSPNTILHSSLPSWLGGMGTSFYSEGKSKYYVHETTSHFPPRKGGNNGHLSPSDLCHGFPSHLLESVQIVFRTGIAEPEKNEAHLSTLSTCISNLLIFSDLGEEMLNRTFIDVLADLPPSYRVDDPPFDAYEEQKAEHAKGIAIEKSNRGWKLDKFKFLPMIDQSHRINPDAKWYVFIETDVYMFWDTLFRLLEQLDPEESHYLGKQVHVGRMFAYGGAGFVISRGLMKRLVGDGTSMAARYEDYIRGDCCGDAVLAWAILDKTGVTLEGMYPTFDSDDIPTIQVDKETWCVPLLTFHHLEPDKAHSLWEWERTRPYDEEPMTFSKFLVYNLADRLSDGDTSEFWDNLSDLMRPEGSPDHALASACRASCLASDKCLQWNYRDRQCRFAHYIRRGRGTDKDKEFTSGWNIKAMEKLGFKQGDPTDTGCLKTTWLKPERI